MQGKLEAMCDSVFVPYSHAIEEMTKQGSFDEADRYISEISKLYPDLTPLNQPLSATDLVAYCSISSSMQGDNPVKAFMVWFDEIYNKMVRNENS